MREIDKAASLGLPIIPFRIEDVPLSDEMQYYVSSPHWLEALIPPVEEHVQILVTTVQVHLLLLAAK